MNSMKGVSCLLYLSVTTGLSRVECCPGLSDYRIRPLKNLEDDRDRPRKKSYFGCRRWQPLIPTHLPRICR